MKTLPLRALHRELGAKTGPFAGYEMPIQYLNGIVQEHRHCRSRVGFFDLSHMGQFFVTGSGAAEALQRLVPSNLLDLAEGRQKYTVLTNSDGGIIDDIIVGRLPKGFMLVVNAACKDKDFDYLSRQLSSECHIEEWTGRALFAVHGPMAAQIMTGLNKYLDRLGFMSVCETTLKGISAVVSRSGYTGEDGFELSVYEGNAERLARWMLADENVAPIGLGARDTLRIEAGLCLYGHELTETVTPVEAGLKWLIDRTRSNYPGAKTVVRQLREGVERQRTGLLIDGKIPLREGSVLFDQADNTVGHVTSGSYAPSLDQPVAMAMVQSNFAKIGTSLYATVRNHRITASVSSMPFFPHRYNRKVT